MTLEQLKEEAREKYPIDSFYGFAFISHSDINTLITTAYEAGRDETEKRLFTAFADALEENAAFYQERHGTDLTFLVNDIKFDVARTTLTQNSNREGV